MRWYLFLIMLCGFATSVHAEDCFIVSDLESGKMLIQEGKCEKRATPASTFKIAISLMGYDAGILEDTTHPIWAYKPEYVGWLPSWKQDQNPTSWIRNSCIWYSQVITTKLGMERFADYVKLFSYGNEDVSGDRRRNNGLTNSWLSSSLTITPDEQIAFLRRMLKHEFPISSRAYSMTTRLLYAGEIGKGWQLYGKTGSGYRLYNDGARNVNRQIGWYVGWVAKDKKTLLFAYLIQDRQKEKTFGGLRAMENAKKKLTEMLTDIEKEKH